MTYPPRLRKIGLRIGIAIGAVVLVVLGVTGFVAPGFFLGEDKDVGPAASGPERPAVGPEGAAQAIADGFGKHDEIAVRELTCDYWDLDREALIKQTGRAGEAKLVEVRRTSDFEATANVTVPVGKKSFTGTANLVYSGGRWCWSGVGGGFLGMAIVADAKPLIDEFFAAVNAKDRWTVIGLLCDDMTSKDQATVLKMTTGHPALEPEDSTGSVSRVQVTFAGTHNGKSASGSLTADKKSEGFCVSGVVVNVAT
ncbi:hypothetical protein [Amycolatopsis sp. CA-230715]|uniref:hypothetical protein n=1 Tax=Amycolatopsis sp. CA-230715 TaxID=2745196 RepID=UPI001C01FBA9|nr:hypothetical protein [Amycolatopsis sp. CA-230715]QWF79417.1 hypothetical protein HUW46_02825 [Amycolatopsis sp. CA-230715]